MNSLPQSRQLIGWLTGAHYDYADGEIWPKLSESSPRLLLWRLALKLGILNRVKARIRGEVWPRLATTMIGEARCHNIVDCVDLIRDVPGDIVDCGVWRGGSTILLTHAMRELGINRYVWCCDTFDGFDKKDAFAEGQHCHAALKVSLNDVSRNFSKHGVSEDFLITLRGKVQETLAKITSKQVALLRVDVDMYAPTKHCLDTIWPLMPKGGIVIVDDYGCAAFQCKRAVDEFVQQHGVKLIPIDRSGVWWRKE